MKAWRTRPAEAVDLPAIRKLLTLVQGDFEELREEQFVVAQHSGGAILGCCRLRPYPDLCELASLAVADDARAKGVGRAIVDSVLSRTTAPVYLICEDHVVGFFRRFSFSLILPEEAPLVLRPKLEYFTRHIGHMNVMLRP